MDQQPPRSPIAAYASHQIPAEVTARPVLLPDVDLLLVLAGDLVLAHNTTNELKLHWHWQAPGSIKGKPLQGLIVSDGVAYCVAEDHLVALHVNDGSPAWADHDAQKFFVGDAKLLPPAESQDHLYLVDEKGKQYKVAKLSGDADAQWSGTNHAGQVTRGPVTDGHHCYYQVDHLTIAVDLRGDGTPAWTFDWSDPANLASAIGFTLRNPLPPWDSATQLQADLELLNGALVIAFGTASWSFFYCLSAGDQAEGGGRILNYSWDQQLPLGADSQPMAFDSVVLPEIGLVGFTPRCAPKSGWTTPVRPYPALLNYFAVPSLAEELYEHYLQWAQQLRATMQYVADYWADGRSDVRTAKFLSSELVNGPRFSRGTGIILPRLIGNLQIVCGNWDHTAERLQHSRDAVVARIASLVKSIPADADAYTSADLRTRARYDVLTQCIQTPDGNLQASGFAWGDGKIPGQPALAGTVGYTGYLFASPDGMHAGAEGDPSGDEAGRPVQYPRWHVAILKEPQKPQRARVFPAYDASATVEDQNDIYSVGEALVNGGASPDGQVPTGPLSLSYRGGTLSQFPPDPSKASLLNSSLVDGLCLLAAGSTLYLVRMDASLTQVDAFSALQAEGGQELQVTAPPVVGPAPDKHFYLCGKTSEGKFYVCQFHDFVPQ